MRKTLTQALDSALEYFKSPVAAKASIPLLTEDQLSVQQFRQVWGSTTIGFGGLGGAAMTSAVTTVLTGPDDVSYVFFDGRFAYQVPELTDTFRQDLEKRALASVSESSKYHGPAK